jgi:serine phosphatase RsbU (regulator of sigma subunit)/Tfp pilus assembly protein PilF
MNPIPEHIRSLAHQLHQESRLLCDTDPAKSKGKANELLDLARTYGTIEYQILAKENIAYQTWHGGDIPNALKLLEETSSTRKDLQFYAYYDWCAKSISMIHWGQGQYDVAFQTIYDALTLLDEKSQEKDKCLCYWVLGVFFYDLKDYARSLEYYERSFDLSKNDALLDNNISSYNLIGIGCCLKEQGEISEAINHFEHALDLSKKYRQWMQRSRCLYELGNVHYKLEDLSTARTFTTESLRVRSEHQAFPGMISCLMLLADIDKKESFYLQGIEKMQEALQLAEKLRSKTKLYLCYEKLADLHRSLNDYEKAFLFLEKHHELRSEVHGEQSNNRIKELESNFNKLKSEKEAEIQRLINVELKNANELIQSKNEEILSSVHYARLIQQAILPSDDLLKEHLPSHFLLYLPKDIVAGDFYWIELRDDTILFAVADCTGHGVPGAMMSVMCSTALSRAVKEFDLSSPALILDKTAEILTESFAKSSSSLKDGMDLALCCYNPKKQQITFAGAQRAIWLFRDSELVEFKGDKQPIGAFEERQAFSEIEISVEEGDLLYLFTDGFADQFGGTNSKKFKSVQLKELLHHIQKEPLSLQQAQLLTSFNNWKGSEDQTDDICFMGIRF